MTRVLLVNDDGVEAAGLLALRAALRAAGLRVTTLAPAANRSGASRAVTVHGRIAVRRLEDGADPVYACEGTPADCTRIGLLSELGGAPALVLSGINRGINLGDDTGYSGTVGAAVEAALLGVSGIAFSQQGDDGGVGLVERGSHAYGLAPVAAAIALAVLRTPPAAPAALNVNLPARLDPAGGIAIARPGRRTYRAGFVDPPDEGPDGTLLYAAFAGPRAEQPATEDVPGVDFTAVRAGRIAISPVTLDGRLGGAEDVAAWVRGLRLDAAIVAAGTA